MPEGPLGGPRPLAQDTMSIVFITDYSEDTSVDMTIRGQMEAIDQQLLERGISVARGIENNPRLIGHPELQEPEANQMIEFQLAKGLLRNKDIQFISENVVEEFDEIVELVIISGKVEDHPELIRGLK